ncbi:hypothetical protein ACOME3_007637 [Neoechinorhynchus agilis]
MYFCKDHPDSQLVTNWEAGDLVCPSCGNVVGERVVDVSAEWRTFSDDPSSPDGCRVGDCSNEIFPMEYNMATIVGPSIALDPQAERIFQTYEKSKLSAAGVKTLLSRRAEMQSLAELLKIPRVTVENSAFLLKRVGEIKNLNYRNRTILICSCIYIACRQDGEPRTLKEICTVANANLRDVGRCYKQILESTNETLNSVNCEVYLPHFCSQLKMDHKTQSLAVHFSKRVTDLDIAGGRSPQTVAAACIYMASRVNDKIIPVKQICEVTLISRNSIYTMFEMFFRHIKCLLPQGENFQVSWKDLSNTARKELTK